MGVFCHGGHFVDVDRLSMEPQKLLRSQRNLEQKGKKNRGIIRPDLKLCYSTAVIKTWTKLTYRSIKQYRKLKLITKLQPSHIDTFKKLSSSTNISGCPHVEKSS